MKKNSEKGRYNNFFKNIFSYKKSGYLKYFHEVVGNKLYYSFSASVVMTFLDGIGIGFLLAILQIIITPESSNDHTILIKINELLNWIHIGSVNIYGLLTFSISLFLFKGLMSYIQMYLQAHITSKILTKTRASLINSISEMRYDTFIKTDGGTIHNISTIEVNRLNNALHNYLNTMQHIIMAVCYIGLAVFTNFRFVILVFISGGVLLYFYNFLIVYFKQLSTEISKKGNLYNSYLSQLLNNYKYLKTTNAISAYKARLISEINASEEISLKFWKINAFTNSAREPIILLIAGVVIFGYYQWTGQINSVIIYSILLFYRTLNYILLAQSNWQSFHQFSGSIDNIIDTQTRLYNSVENHGGKEFAQFHESIKLKDVDISINNHKILSNVDLNIRKNSTLAIIGKSGSGKTTLASVITGLIPIAKGHLQIDGIALNEYDITSYRSKIGYVSQDPVIFNDSIFNNVTLWAEDNQENQTLFEETASLTHLSELISGLPEQENTMLGDNGMMLSGGQKQRISIARELFKKTEIIVMDEATSSLDSGTENLIRENLKALDGKVTFIIIAHRFSTIQNADNIVLLNDGKISAYGSFDQMMKNSELFRTMVQIQSTSHAS